MLRSGETLHLGVVSKPEHVKNHVRILRELGHKVLILEAAPKDIPEALDAVVVRITSCSKEGSEAAEVWSNKTNKPLIIEAGLSGIKRRIEEINMLVSVKTPKVSFPPMPKQSMSWEGEVNESRLRRNFDFVQTSAVQKFALRNQKALVEGLFTEPDPVFPSLPDPEVEDLKGKPLRFFILVLGLLTPEQQARTSRSMLRRYYRSISGKNTTRHVIDACAWVYGLNLPTKASDDDRSIPLFDEPTETVAPTHVEASAYPEPVSQRTVEEALRKLQGSFQAAVDLVPEPMPLPQPAPTKTDTLEQLRATVEDFALMSTSASEEATKRFASLEQKLAALEQQNERLLAIQEATLRALHTIQDQQASLATSLENLAGLQRGLAAIQEMTPAPAPVQGDLLGNLQVLQSMGAQVTITLGAKV